MNRPSGAWTSKRDPSKLDEVYGWTVSQIVGRYVTLGLACFAVLAAVWIYATWSARRAGDAA